MLPIKHSLLSGWGRVAKEICAIYCPENYAHIASLIGSHKNGMVARGMGRTFGDAALEANGVVITEQLRHFISFDEQQGVIRAQAGVTLSEVLEVTIPKGWFLPVVPDTSYMTLGGAVACNIHGKNHFRQGDFASHVLDIQLRLPNGEVCHAAPGHNQEVFWATAGGMGMTGIIEEVAIQLIPVKSISLYTTSHKVANAIEMVEAMQEYKNQSDYMVGWIDMAAPGKKLGSGVFRRAIHCDEAGGGIGLNHYRPVHEIFIPPRIATPHLFHKRMLKIYNKLRFFRYTSKPKTELIHFHQFFYPLDRLYRWSRLYGKKGMVQYQCFIPESDTMGTSLHHLLAMIYEHGQRAAAATIKYHEKQKFVFGHSEVGLSITLNFPHSLEVKEMVHAMNHYLISIGGTVCLVNDIVLTREHFNTMYASILPQWKSQLATMDPNRLFTSAMAKRLGFKDF